MTFFDDSPTPATPLSGDPSLFDRDLISPAKSSSERVVDTQSGFLVVIKQVGDRFSLTCKRRVGTPPTSNILLTPDESIKLSKVLAGVVNGVGGGESSAIVPPLLIAGQRGFNKACLFFAAAAVVIAGFVGFIGGVNIHSNAMRPPAADVAKPGELEKFTRTFVMQMLDFNPSTYRASQIRAMSSMSRELMEKYWQETNFPLTEKQLKLLPQDSVLIIDRIDAHTQTSAGTPLDVYAQLVGKGAAKRALHIRLKVLKDNTGGFRVTDQEDVTESDSQPNETRSGRDTTGSAKHN